MFGSAPKFLAWMPSLPAGWDRSYDAIAYGGTGGVFILMLVLSNHLLNSFVMRADVRRLEVKKRMRERIEAADRRGGS
jgi:hypothetical protein